MTPALLFALSLALSEPTAAGDVATTEAPPSLRSDALLWSGIILTGLGGVSALGGGIVALATDAQLDPANEGAYLGRAQLYYGGRSAFILVGAGLALAAGGAGLITAGTLLE